MGDTLHNQLAIPPPPPVPTGTDVRELRQFLNNLRSTVYALATVVNNTRGGYASSVVVGGGDSSAKDPAQYTTIGGTTEGNEAAETTTWTVGDVDGSGNKKGCWFYIQTRKGYFDAGDMKLYAYVRKVTIDATGKVYSVGAETRVTLEIPETA